jgi:peptidoglycan hydrolase-like protein with peptidoglycan-binding domain
MKLDGRNLVFGMEANDVRELQCDLAWLGIDHFGDETFDGGFSETTKAAVHLFQKPKPPEASGLNISQT